MPTPSILDQTALVEQEAAEREEEARRLFADLMAWLVLEGAGQERLDAVETELWRRLLSLGVALLALWLAVRRPRQVPRAVQTGGRRYGHRGDRKATFKSRFGVVPYRRDVYVSGRSPGSKLLAPFDHDLGLAPGRLTLGVALTTAAIAVRLAFAETGRVLRAFLGYVPSPRSMLGIIDFLGPYVRPFFESLAPPDDDGEILVLLVDGRGAPMVTEAEMKRRRRPHVKRPAGFTGRKWRQHKRRQRPKKRRTKGKKSKNAKVAVLGVLYTMRRTPDGWEGPIHKRVIGTFRGHRALFEWLASEAAKRGYPAKKTYFLADGARAIWSLAKDFFPKAIHCLDWYHLVEYLWKAGETVYKEGTPELVEWVQAQKKALRQGDVEQVLGEMRVLQGRIGASGPGTKGRRLHPGGAATPGLACRQATVTGTPRGQAGPPHRAAEDRRSCVCSKGHSQALTGP